MAKTIEFIPATPDDLRDLFRWRNDPKVRRQMFTTGKIRWEDHVSFWKKRFADKKAKTYIIYHNGISSGMLRIDKRTDGDEIGIIIAPEWQGMGIGKAVIQAVISKCASRPLLSRVKTDNEASKRIFDKNGFRPIYTLYELR